MNNFLLLSEEEIAVAAAFLGKQTFYGINAGFMVGWEEKISKRTFKIAEGLEKRFLLFVGADGEVQMNPLLYDCLSCMIEPEMILFWEERKSPKEQKREYYFRKSDKICRMENRAGAIKKLTLTKQMPEAEKEVMVIRENISAALLKQVEALEEDFEYEKAEELLKGALLDDRHFQIVKKIRSKKYFGGMLCLASWKEQKILKQMQVEYGIMEGKIFFISREEGNLILTDEKSQYLAMIHTFFGGNKNGRNDCNSQ